MCLTLPRSALPSGHPRPQGPPAEPGRAAHLLPADLQELVKMRGKAGKGFVFQSPDMALN